jgi:succinoglycan biosynthesis protein ExoV
MLHYSNYFKIAHGNFGDDLNPWLWSRLAPEVCDPEDPTLFLGIGTILGGEFPKEPMKVVFGSGCGYARPPEIDNKWAFYAVRGPLTAAKLKLEASIAITDPAILVRRVPISTQRKLFPLSFMPHHQSMQEANWKSLCARAGLH